MSTKQSPSITAKKRSFLGGLVACVMLAMILLVVWAWNAKNDTPQQQSNSESIQKLHEEAAPALHEVDNQLKSTDTTLEKDLNTTDLESEINNVVIE